MPMDAAFAAQPAPRYMQPLPGGRGSPLPPEAAEKLRRLQRAATAARAAYLAASERFNFAREESGRQLSFLASRAEESGRHPYEVTSTGVAFHSETSRGRRDEPAPPFLAPTVRDVEAALGRERRAREERDICAEVQNRNRELAARLEEWCAVHGYAVEGRP